MTVEIFDVKTAALTVSSAAAQHLQQQLRTQGKRAVRISVKESGCTGYMYVMDEVDVAEEDDLLFTQDNGLKLYLDPDSLALMQGTLIDYELEGINRSIKFHNPNVTAACGCGESFSIS